MSDEALNEEASEETISEADRLRALIEKAWDTDPDVKFSMFLLMLEDEDLLCAARYAGVIKSALRFE